LGGGAVHHRRMHLRVSPERTGLRPRGRAWAWALNATLRPTSLHRMTVPPSLDVVGIGNALVDVLSHEDHSFIAEHGLERGAMTLVDPDRAERLYAAMGPAMEVSGGSAGNTIAGVASFGGRA